MLVRPIAAFRALTFAGVALALGCANKPPTGGSGTYRGVMVGVTEIGIVQITVGAAPSGPLPASGTIEIGGTVISLSGTLDRSHASLSLSSTTGYLLEGDSRPTYVLGAYQSPQDAGSFALFLEPADGSPVLLFCGSFAVTSTTNATPLPFAVAAVPPKNAFCVGPGFAWFGSLDGNATLSCESSGGLFSGNTNADGGNLWGTGDNYGTWTVAPCGGGADDAGVDSGTGNTPDAAATDSADAEVD
jgi:hypothetical protein